MSLLRLTGLSASYGKSQALFDVNMQLEQGEVLALMGRNGMGKSTTIRCLFGLLPTGGGQLEFDGHNLARLAPHKIARLGLGLVPEGRRCFSTLTVQENLRVAARSGPWDMASVSALFPRLAERKQQYAASLSGGEQQMLAIGRALMTNPRLLVLDEATEGLAPLVRQEIWKAISKVKAEGHMSIILVDKSLKELSKIADRAVILQRGKSVWNGAMGDLPADIASRYLGV